MLLALDTSTAAVTAAVHSGAPGTPGEVLAVETVVDARGAGEHLAPAVDQLLVAKRPALEDGVEVRAGALLKEDRGAGLDDVKQLLVG